MIRFTSPSLNMNLLFLLCLLQFSDLEYSTSVNIVIEMNRAPTVYSTPEKNNSTLFSEENPKTQHFRDFLNLHINRIVKERMVK